MDELMISGRRFISSSRAAKEHGYHSDYVGQLIRSGKVKGQKVGRAWYVDAESLAVYLGKEIAEVVAEYEAEEKKEEAAPATETVSEIKKEITLEPETLKEESSVEEEHPIRISKLSPEPEIENKIKLHTPEVEKRESGLVYISDDEPLLPEIRKERIVYREPEATIVVEPMPEKKETKEHRGYLRQGVALFSLGIFVLVAVTALSTLLAFNMSVGPTETAGIHLSLPE